MIKKLIIIAGPTAVGKTDISIELAKRVNGEIISADSMQVYRMMDIGTAKIKEEEMQGIKHYLIDILDARDEFNITIFQNLAKKAIEEIYAKGKIPIIVGGTGFYIQALLYDIEFENEDEEKKTLLRKSLEEEYDTKGSDFMLEKLKSYDEEAAGIIHKNNKKRLIRAIEYAIINKKQISKHNEEQRSRKSEYDFRFFVLNMDRKKLYDRINYRVELMFKEGLIQEFKSLLARGCKSNMTAMQGIGYKELFAYTSGELSLEEVKEEIKKDTRHFAKRQLTWFKREKESIWIDKDEFCGEKLLEEMYKYLDFTNN